MSLFADNGTSILFVDTLNGVTGSLFLSLLAIVGLLMLLAMMLRIPLEFTAIIVLPFLLALTAYESSMMSVLGVVLIYLGVLVAKNMFFWR